MGQRSVWSSRLNAFYDDKENINSTQIELFCYVGRALPFSQRVECQSGGPLQRSIFSQYLAYHRLSEFNLGDSSGSDFEGKRNASFSKSKRSCDYANWLPPSFVFGSLIYRDRIFARQNGKGGTVRIWKTGSYKRHVHVTPLSHVTSLCMQEGSKVKPSYSSIKRMYKRRVTTWTPQVSLVRNVCSERRLSFLALLYKVCARYIGTIQFDTHFTRAVTCGKKYFTLSSRVHIRSSAQKLLRAFFLFTTK